MSCSRRAPATGLLGSITRSVVRAASVAMCGVLGILGGLAILLPAGCDRPSSHNPPPQTVVLYSSVDDELLRGVIEDFQRSTGVMVKVVGDTEATKTTGLVERLVSERAAPRADVWWSSEPLGTMRLYSEGVLEPLPTPAATTGAEEWDALVAGPENMWHGFAQRARVIAFNYKNVSQADVPRTLRGLCDPRWKGRVGMARPQFGTARVQMASLVAIHGPQAFESWLTAMKDNGVRLYDGNASVARAVAMGELDLGLVDTDDVWAGQRNGWPIGHVYEKNELATSPETPGGAAARDEGRSGLPSAGPLLMPNTVALVKGGPNRDAARQLAFYLLSTQVERNLAAGDSHNIPVRPGIARDFQKFAVPQPASLNWPDAAARMADAMAICDRVLGD